MQGVESLIKKTIGEKYIEFPPFDLEKLFYSSTFLKPLIFLLTPGSDPTTLLIKFAQERGINEKSLKFLSLGKGQGKNAEKLIQECVKDGGWVILQNCHLAVSWLGALEKILEVKYSFF